MSTHPVAPVNQVRESRGGDTQPDTSRLGAAEQRVAGPPGDHDNTVAILDDWEHEIPDKGFAHGAFVEQLLLNQSGLSADHVERYETDPRVKMPDKLSDGGLDDFIESSYVNVLDSTSDNLSKILQDDDIEVINQSMGVSEADITKILSGQAGHDPAFRAQLCSELGLPDSSSEKDLMQALVDRVGRVHDQSDSIKASQARYDDLSGQIDARGISYTVAAGNEGRLAGTLQELGVQTDDDFMRSAFDNGHNTMVGASDGNGNPAPFTSPDAGAEIAMDGADVVGTVNGHTASMNGTSFSSPEAAAVIVKMRQANPNLSDEEVEAILEQSASGSANPEQLGAGQVDPALAVQLAAAA